MRTIGIAVICAACLGSTAWAQPAPSQPTTVPARLTLDEALQMVAQRRPALAAARERTAAARAGAVSARQRPNPTIGVSSEGSRPWAGGARGLDSQEMILELSQEIETGGRRHLRGASADATAEAAWSDENDERRRVWLETGRAYFQLALSRMERENAAATLDEVDKVIAVNRSRYQQGEVSGVELRRLEVERLKFADEALLAGLAEQNARAVLLSLLGSNRLDAPLEPTDGFEVLPARQAAVPGGLDAGGLIARALDARPDIKSAGWAVTRAQSEFQLQRAIRLPNVTFGAGYKRDFGDNGLVLTASLPLPLFDRNAGGIARAAAERLAATSELREAYRAVSLEVQQAVNAVSTMRTRLSTLESGYLQKAREARDAASSAYRSGATDLIDYLDAQRAYRDVQRMHQRARFDLRISLLELDAATDSGWETRR